MVTALRNIILVLLILSHLPINSVAETETNITLKDNAVILLDDSCGTNLWQHKSSVDFIDFNDVINVNSNVSIITYGYSNDVFNNLNSDYLDLIFFLQSIKIYSSPLPRCDNVYQAFNDSKSILDNATGSKQIILISDGNIDGKYGSEKLDDVSLIDLINSIKKDNITINFYQVLDANESIRDVNDIMKPYSDLGKGTNTDIVILNGNGSERLHFLNYEIEKPLIYGENGEYSNELFGSNETALVVFTMMYQKSSFESYTVIDFYRNCDEYDCTIIPIGRNGKIFDEQEMSEIFRGRYAIEMVKSGNIIEKAYLISNPASDLICGYYDSETLREEAKNAAVLVIEKSSDKSELKKIRTIKRVLDVKKLNVVSLIISGECEISNLDDLQKRIMEGGKYTYNLRNGLYTYGDINAFKNYNNGLIKLINERNNDIVRTIIYFFNSPIYYEAKPLLEANSNQLSKLQAIDHSENVELATEQINKKKNESNISIGNATERIDALNQIINGIKNIDSEALQKRKDKAQEYLDAAKDNQSKSKFNTAIRNANISREIARGGIGESENKQNPTISIAMSITAFIIVAILIKRKMKE